MAVFVSTSKILCVTLTQFEKEEGGILTGRLGEDAAGPGGFKDPVADIAHLWQCCDGGRGCCRWGSCFAGWGRRKRRRMGRRRGRIWYS